MAGWSDLGMSVDGRSGYCYRCQSYRCQCMSTMAAQQSVVQKLEEMQRRMVAIPSGRPSFYCMQCNSSHFGEHVCKKLEIVAGTIMIPELPYKKLKSKLLLIKRK